MVLETGFHLEQPMRTRGWITLAGQRYEVDGTTVRDRSWGQLRREFHVDAPPLMWTNGVLGSDLAFGTTAFDTPDRHPEWEGLMSIPGGDPLRAGWVYRDGEYSPAVSVSKRTFRNETTLFPESIELAIHDAIGNTMDLHGTVTAVTDWRPWHNMSTIFGLVRWECDGREGWGDLNDVLYQPYASRFAGDLFGRRAAA
jgi:hypothetical protein